MAIISHKVEGVANDVTHYTRIFPVNKKGHAQSELDGQIASALTNAFPTEPTEYILLETVTASQTWTAPADGYYQIDVHGASGNGGGSNSFDAHDVGGKYNSLSGGGGQGSGYGSSIVKLNKGDTLEIVAGAVGSLTSVQINSSIETYSSISVTSGANGGNASQSAPGGGGSGGAVSSGGNVSNITGNSGGQGSMKSADYKYTAVNLAGGVGGSPAHVDGNTGGVGAGRSTYNSAGSPGSGSSGKIIIFAGNTNAA